MSTRGPGLVKQLWYCYKALKLPWRRQFLIGADLSGNTFWEFKDALNANRLRRIVKFSRKAHYADVKISPQWHQWLRHTRDEPPSIQEQQYDVSRQAMMKQLASEADERWKSKPSFLDSPARSQPSAPTAIEESTGDAAREQVDSETELGIDGVKSPVGDQQEVKEASESRAEQVEERPRSEGLEKKKKREREESPWQRADRGAPSENWRPAAWTPGTAQRR